MYQRKGFMPFQAKLSSEDSQKEMKAVEAEKQLLRDTISKKDLKIGDLELEIEKQSDNLFELQDKISSLKQRLLISEEKQEKMQKLIDSHKQKIEAEKMASRQNENRLRKVFESKIRQAEENAEFRKVPENFKSGEDFFHPTESGDLVCFLRSAHERIKKLEALLLNEKTILP